jgi:hypothetical protein
MGASLALLLATLAAGSFHLSGQASGWTLAGYDTSFAGQAGLRYIPTLSSAIGPLDAELAVNAYSSWSGRARAESSFAIRHSEFDIRVKPYRAWLRYPARRFEARVGLQKLNFGSATLLRPLQWFDHIDPRDPLALTDGVYAGLARYYFPNNANVWAWTLIGNSVPKGYEQLATNRWCPEFGGRAQLPISRGEVAATYHHRWFDQRYAGNLPVIVPNQDEDRIGLDAKMDVGPGLWLELTATRRERGSEAPVWQRLACIGADYTFNLGSGLYVCVEHMALGSGSGPFFDQDGQVSAALASYPLGLVDQVRALVFVDWQNSGVYRFASWQRTLDNWVLSAAVFWNPDRPAALAGTGGGSAGKGILLTVAFNH